MCQPMAPADGAHRSEQLLGKAAGAQWRLFDH
jgi:hypothetical protein